MSRRAAIAVALIVIAAGGAALAHGETRQSGKLRVSFDGGFTPSSLPRERAVPVTISVAGRISTTDGSHPPPLRRLRLELNRNGRISTAGLPRCRAPLLQSTSGLRARERCPGALVGSGSFTAELSSAPAPIGTRGRILVFNARRQGGPALLLHLHTTTPLEATSVLPLRIRRLDGGQFGTALATRLPKLAGGVGAITSIDLEIGRQYTHRGERRGYISASCAAPAGFTQAIFTFARGSFHFGGGRAIDASLTGGCRVRG